MTRYDAAVIGGGAIGSAAAYFLLAAAPGLRALLRGDVASTDPRSGSSSRSLE
jgi:glycine/D-amino acid oxidase-like deaminating enzyme